LQTIIQSAELADSEAAGRGDAARIRRDVRNAAREEMEAVIEANPQSGWAPGLRNKLAEE
jgi:hypothetical protein